MLGGENLLCGADMPNLLIRNAQIEPEILVEVFSFALMIV